MTKLLSTLFRLLRADNWVKNLLILLPCFFGRKITDPDVMISVLIAILIFCLLSSSIYIINDIVDAPHDRNHPKKKFRPIAAKEVSVTAALVILAILLICVVLIAPRFLSASALLFLCFYLAFNVLYSFWLKNQLIIDIFSIAIFFEIRLFYGGVVANIEVSHWLVITVFFLASLIALGKRRDDILIQEESKQVVRKTSKYYNLIYLDAMIVITSSMLVFIYIIYSISDSVVQNFGSYFYLSDIFVVLGLSKYLHLLFVDKKSGNPVKILFKDRFIHICVLLWFSSVLYFIYLGHA
ncbi:hypothetical protein DBR32_13430 [Taibaiella sp. KBW10]|uniref:UbiA prenyltransferase family protein n=1 Tax=Taibaiella sp. KBW10 TaxID=2153357 RepID=UPI000F598C02|nr:UbiA prenyltransferase family protein [Taibaiella sp. KBW10]RQO30554.1 hypothetical protein DBR32_13430 [Taibaiella sp. KBW10]